MDSELASDSWHQWLLTSAASGLDYTLIFWEDRIEVEFYNTDCAQAFALEFGL